MEIISQLQSAWGGVYLALAVLFLFTVIVFIHELGHYAVARWCGAKVDTFSIGFGPEIFGWTAKSGTRWRVAWLPLGGYVKFIDDTDIASTTQKKMEDITPEDREGTFQGLPVGQRAAVVAAGPIANFLLAIVIFAGIFAVIGAPQTKARVDVVSPDSAAAAAGFVPGDVIVAIDGTQIETFQDLRSKVAVNPGVAMDFTVQRDGRQLVLTATPRENVVERFNKQIREGLLGIQYRATDEERTFRPVGVFEAVGLGVTTTWQLISDTVGFLLRIVTFTGDPNGVGGLVTITKAAGEAASVGVIEYATFIALISISLGVVNLLPIPVLDGGHLVFYAVEAFRGQPLDERTQQVGFQVGLALILMIVLAVNGPEIYAELQRILPASG